MLIMKVELDFITNGVKDHWEEVIYTKKDSIRQSELIHLAFESWKAEIFPKAEITKKAIKKVKISNLSDKEVFLLTE